MRNRMFLARAAVLCLLLTAAACSHYRAATTLRSSNLRAYDGPRRDDVRGQAAGPRRPGPTLRGTGCALASSIAALHGAGHDLIDAMEEAAEQLRHWWGDARAAGRRALPPLAPPVLPPPVPLPSRERKE